jgi:DNA-binding FrmR family transcriptional regulator
VAERPVYWDEADLLRRLKRIEGQVRGVQAMVLRKESCRAILTQMAAIEGALAQVSRIVGACGVAEGLSDVGSLGDVEAVRRRLKQVILRP